MAYRLCFQKFNIGIWFIISLTLIVTTTNSPRDGAVTAVLQYASSWCVTAILPREGALYSKFDVNQQMVWIFVVAAVVLERGLRNT